MERHHPENLLVPDIPEVSIMEVNSKVDDNKCSLNWCFRSSDPLLSLALLYPESF